MSNSNSIRRTGLVATLLLALAAGSCGPIVDLGGTDAPQALYTLAMQQPPIATDPEGESRSLRADLPLLVEDATAPAELRTLRILVRPRDIEVAYLPDVRWNDRPSRMFTRMLISYLNVDQTAPILTGRQIDLPYRFRLSGRISEFQLEPNAGEGRSVLVGYVATLAEAAPMRFIATRKFEKRIEIASDDHETVSRALNEAANDCAAQVVSWLKSRAELTERSKATPKKPQ